MKKNEVEKREQLSKELEMSFDETLELFSEETLGTMVMMEITGGIGEVVNYNCPCTVMNRHNCNNCKNCSKSICY